MLQSEYGLNAIFLLIIVMSANFLTPLFPCQIQNLFSNSMLAKHILGFLTLLFGIAFNNYEEADNIPTLFGKTVIYYLWFVVMTRMNAYLFIFLIWILGMTYVLSIYIKKNDVNLSDKKIRRLKKIRSFLYSFSIILTIVGFIIYYKERRDEFQNDFKWSKFIKGRTTCSNIHYFIHK